MPWDLSVGQPGHWRRSLNKHVRRRKAELQKCLDAEREEGLYRNEEYGGGDDTVAGEGQEVHEAAVVDNDHLTVILE